MNYERENDPRGFSCSARKMHTESQPRVFSGESIALQGNELHKQKKVHSALAGSQQSESRAEQVCPGVLSGGQGMRVGRRALQ